MLASPTCIAVVEVKHDFQPCRFDSPSHCQGIIEVVLAVLATRPDPNTRQVGSAVFDDRVELGDGTVVSVDYPRVLQVDHGADIRSFPLKRMDQREAEGRCEKRDES